MKSYVLDARLQVLLMAIFVRFHKILCIHSGVYYCKSYWNKQRNDDDNDD